MCLLNMLKQPHNHYLSLRGDCSSCRSCQRGEEVIERDGSGDSGAAAFAKAPRDLDLAYRIHGAAMDPMDPINIPHLC